MMTLIEVQCPHCGAKGQLLIPPVGTIIIGPCPECQGTVVVFCGQCLAIDGEALSNGTLEQKKDLLMAVLTAYLAKRIETLLSDSAKLAGPETGAEPGTRRHEANPTLFPDTSPIPPRIDQGDWDLLRRPGWFEEIFGKPPP